MRKRLIALSLILCTGAGCGEGEPTAETKQADVQQIRVETSGKVPVALSDVPAAVIETVRAAQPDLQLAEASAERRDGRNYYDMEGTLPDGSELELDLLEEDGSWRVVEIQRDIAPGDAPAPVRAVLEKAENGFAPARVIESRQAGEDLTIYEFYSSAPQGEAPRKLEIKFDGTKAELLVSEWAH